MPAEEIDNGAHALNDKGLLLVSGTFSFEQAFEEGGLGPRKMGEPLRQWFDRSPLPAGRRRRRMRYSYRHNHFRFLPDAASAARILCALALARFSAVSFPLVLSRSMRNCSIWARKCARSSL